MAEQSEADVMNKPAPDEEAEDEFEDEYETDESDFDDELDDDKYEEYEAEDEGGDDRAEEALRLDDNAAGSDAVNADALHVSVDFSLGCEMISVSDMRALAPGYVFHLDREQGTEIAIVAGGREIGRGEIVQVADRLGVRIIKLEEGPSA